LLQLQSTDLILEYGILWDEAIFYWEPIFLHSKLRIIDDRYLSVGSCNMNNRGYKYEGEVNISILDEEFSSTARQTIFEHYVGEEYSSYLSDDAQNNFDLLFTVAEFNQASAEWWDYYDGDLTLEEAEEEWTTNHPFGFVYPLNFDEGYLYISSPDLF
jgi:phosphatidylserine/phosphatidylglycerophosphate/cardiolipin synthase-like enzyme